MSSFKDLNSWGAQAIIYDIPLQTTYRDSPTASFTSPNITWEMARTLGPLTGQGVSITYDVSESPGTTVSFNNTAASTNTLSVLNPGPGLYEISGILTVVDYAAAIAEITPDPSNTGDVSYQIQYENTNQPGNITVEHIGVV